MFFPSILAGPSYTYNSYDSFTSKRLFLKETSSSSIPDKITSNDIPAGRKRKALKRFGLALVFLGIYSTYGGQYGMEKLLEGKFVAQRSLLHRWVEVFAYFAIRIGADTPIAFAHRIGFMNLAGFVARTKYYAVWCMASVKFPLSFLVPRSSLSSELVQGDRFHRRRTRLQPSNETLRCFS